MVFVSRNDTFWLGEIIHSFLFEVGHENID